MKMNIKHFWEAAGTPVNLSLWRHRLNLTVPLLSCSVVFLSLFSDFSTVTWDACSNFSEIQLP